VESVQTLSDILKQKHLYNFFSRRVMEKALAYKAQGRVSKVEIENDLTHIRANVRGSGSNNYRVDIELEFTGDRLSELDGDCSCPVGFNCKHVASTLLEAVSGQPPTADWTVAARQSNPMPRPLPYAVTEWLNQIGIPSRSDDYPPDINQRLLYCFYPASEGPHTPSLKTSLRSVRMQKGGDLAASFTQPPAVAVSPERAPRYYRASDIDIVAELSAGSARYDYRAPPMSAKLQQRIVETGRAYWLEHSGREPLRWGEKREGRIEWRPAGKSGVVPHLVVPGAVTLLAEPPVYIDEAANLIGPVELDLAPRLAWQLLSAPAIPQTHVAAVSRRLGDVLPQQHHHLLPAKPEPVVQINENPTPILRLLLGERSRSGYDFYHRERARDDRPIAVARLSFRYGPIELSNAPNADRAEGFHDGQVHRITRRPGREKAVRRRLTEHGFLTAYTVFSGLDRRHVNDMSFKEPRDWFNFLGPPAEKLKAEGYEIHIDHDFPYRTALSTEDFDATFESSGIDWFELAVGIEIDGKRHDLAPLVAALLATPGFTPDTIKGHAERGERFYLPLTDGRHVSLAADRFLPLVLALHNLQLSGLFDDRAAKIRLQRAEVLPLLGLENDKFVFSGADNLRRLADVLRASGSHDVALPDGFRAVLRPYQAQGVAWLDLLRECGLGGVLADDMGLGKTVQVLALLALQKARGHLTRPALIVAPTSLMTNWFNEARKFAPNLRVLVLHGAGRKQHFASITEHDVVLTTYPLIARDREVLLSRDWHMAVLDEAQTVKNPDAATTRWLRDVKAQHRFCLTGTPMENHLGELWSIMSFANPGYLGDKAGFSRQWRTPIEKRADTARAAALARRVRPFMMRRTKAEVANELPPKSEIVESIVLEGSQRDLYDSIRLSMSEKVRKAIAQRGLAKSHIIVLEALLRMRQACCDPALLKLDDGVERPSAKLDRLMEMVLELLSEGRKIILFSQFTSMLEIVRKRFDAGRISYSVLTGETKDRARAVEGFQKGKSDVFLISLKAGGVGLNLTAADTVVIFDPWWNPAVEEQAIDRAHRIGQNKAVFVYRLVAAGTIEEKMDELKARKRALADGLFDQKGQIASVFTEDDVRALFDS
jgi:superfamily II DNA or RNA helicase